MYLSKLDIFGFKSFAMKTQLEFRDGTSCIIGPNGSGKSNIVDAIRWVLGEQKANTLRSDKMENVIFNGTRLRKPVGMTEVSLTIQNSKKVLPTEFDEVVVSRRLYRSGESQYLINKTPVRLKDVTDLFMDTGLGPNSYSVIELKMVESILSENKNERRQMLDEAAGIVKYKLRRRSALRKLESTRNDLTRLHDIVNEVQKNVNTLSRQVGKARRYLEYVDLLKKLEIDLARYRFHHLWDEIRPLNLKIQEAGQKKDERSHQITIDEALLERLRKDSLDSDRLLIEIQQKLSGIDRMIAGLRQTIAVSETRIEEIGKLKINLLAEIDELARKKETASGYLQNYLLEIEELELKTESETEKVQALQDAKNLEQVRINEFRKEIDDLNLRFKNRLNELSTLKEKLNTYQYQLGFENSQKEQLNVALQNFAASREALNSQLLSVSEVLGNIRSELNNRVTLLTQFEAEKEILITYIQDEESSLHQIISEIEKARARYNFFKQILSSYEGHALSTRFIMENRTDFNGIHAPLSDIISADEKYAPLIEIILGEALNYIVVDSAQIASSVFSQLRERDKGRITLIPLDRIAAINYSAAAPPAGLTYLLDKIECDSKYRHLLKILLEDVVIVNSLNEGLKLAAEQHNLRVITMEGEVVNFNREISGGILRRSDAGIVGRRDNLQKYKALTEEHEKKAGIVRENIGKLREKLSGLDSQIKQDKEEISRLEKAKQDHEKTENQIQYEINALLRNTSETQLKLGQIDERIGQLDQQIKLAAELLAGSEQTIRNEEKEVIRKTSEYEKNLSLLQSAADELQQAQIAFNSIRNQLNNRRQDAERSRQSVTEMSAQREKHEKSIIQAETDAEQSRIKISEAQKQLEAEFSKRDQSDRDSREIEHAGRELKEKIQVLDQQTRKYRREHDESQEMSRKLELTLKEYTIKAENTRERILKLYNEDIELTLPFDGMDEKAAEAEIESLEQRIKMIGPVNPLAVQEYDQEKERYDFLMKQINDLEEAEAMLIETINKINETARKQFSDTFGQIKINFEKVFNSFFENGEGTILMTDQDDPLESDIEITVRTKGKQLQTLSLLSGGEKTLTAISLLFAIYLVKPSPFCILDEVDAPLDDVNIVRFTDALRSFSNNTQFIVVTHNKRTMEAAETMYGVTMEEEGVSKIISVQFN